jgi:putative membrane protein
MHAICTRPCERILKNKMDNDKKIILAIALYAAIMVLVFHSVAVQAQIQKEINNTIAMNENSEIAVFEEEVSDFLTKSADARMLNAQEGLLARERGVSPSIRLYGQHMMEDHSMLLKKIKVLAAERNIYLSDKISNRKVEEHQNLSEETGHEFDEKFVKLLISDYEKDVKLFRKAAQYNDPEISAFAQQYLPLIQSHLDRVRKIKSTLNN